MKRPDMLSGVFAPLTTPFDGDEVDYDGLERNLERLNATGLKGYFALGTNGEFKSLSVEERFKVLEVVVRSASRDKTCLLYTSPSPRDS